MATVNRNEFSLSFLHDPQLQDLLNEINRSLTRLSGKVMSMAMLFLVVVFSGCTSLASSPLPEADPSVSVSSPLPETDPSVPVDIGSGQWHYQLELEDQNGPKANVPFALSLPNHHLPFVDDEKNVWQGVTDAQGRTPVFALPFQLGVKDVFLRRRFGFGPNGEQFVMLDKIDNSPISSFPYRVVVCTQPPQEVFGFSDDGGNAVYVATQEPVDLFLYESDSVEVWDALEGHRPVKELKAAIKANKKACKKAQ